MATVFPTLARPPRQSAATGVSSAFGTFGEIMQGVLPDGTDVLVTLPIARWSTATFVAEPDRPGIRIRPAHKEKALRLARAVLAELRYSGGGRLRLESCLPEGKGMASSSADLVATARAVGNAFGQSLRPRVLEDLLREIEPTDGVMHDGVVAFDHRRVRLRAPLGALPPVTVVGLDEGGAIDTIEFNNRPKPFGVAERREYGRLLDRLVTAVHRGDLATVGEVATRSAALNQPLAPKRNYLALVEASREVGAIGVVVAHSGTVLGLLLADNDPDYWAKRAVAERVCQQLGATSIHYGLSFGRY